MCMCVYVYMCLCLCLCFLSASHCVFRRWCCFAGFRFLFTSRLANCVPPASAFSPPILSIRNRISVVFIIMNVHRVQTLTHINKQELISRHHQANALFLLFLRTLIIPPCCFCPFFYIPIGGERVSKSTSNFFVDLNAFDLQNEHK